MYKVISFDILKPINMSWKELGQILRSAQYRARRFATLCATEQWLSYYNFVNGNKDFVGKKPSQINRELRAALISEDSKRKEKFPELHDRFSATGALPDTVVSAITQYKISSALSKSKKLSVLTGDSSVPTFGKSMSIPIRCDKDIQCKLELNDDEVNLKLMLCRQPYPEVVLKTQKITGSQKATLQYLLDSPKDQRCLELKNVGKNWKVLVVYSQDTSHYDISSKGISVGVDLGHTYPIYVASTGGKETFGRELGAIRKEMLVSHQRLCARRREIQKSGNRSISGDTARVGHGRNRILLPTQKLERAIHNSYTTFNHKLSRLVVDFALRQKASCIQMEDLSGLQEVLSGTFLGSRWRYHQLQEYIVYKAKSCGIDVKFINPKYTSRRCSDCGFINKYFNRQYRDKAENKNLICKQCKAERHADENAAANIALPNIGKAIMKQCKKQGIEY